MISIVKSPQITTIFKNEYLFSLLVRFGHTFLSIFTNIFLTRFLGQTLKGTSSYIQSCSSIGAIIVTFGIHQAYPFFKKKYGKESFFDDYLSAVYLLFSFYLLCSILANCLIPLSIEIRFVLFLAPILGYSNIVSYLVLIDTPNRRNALLILIDFSEFLFSITLFLFVKSNIYWILIFYGSVELSKSILFTCLLRTRITFSNRIWGMYVKLFRFGFFPMLALLLTMLNYRIDVIMLKDFSDVEYSSIALYSIGILFSEKIILIPDTLQGILASRLSKGAGAIEVVKICRFSFFSCIAMCIAILTFGKFLIPILYGKEYAGSYPIVAISAFGSIVICYFKLIAQYNIINNKQIINVLILCVSIVANVIGNIIFIPIWGIKGAALATCIAHFLCGFVFLMYFSAVSKYSPFMMFIPQKGDFDLLKSYFNSVFKKHKTA